MHSIINPVRWYHLTFFASLVFVLLPGCRIFTKNPSVTVGNTTVTAPKDIGKPASIDQSQGHSTLGLAAGSEITTTKTEAVPALGDAPARPATTVTTIRLAKDTEWQSFDTTTHAQTGVTDTTAAVHQQDVDARKPLLYMMIVAILAAAFSMYTEHPNAALWCGGGAAIFFAAWRISAIPEWVIAIGVLACGGAIGLHMGFFKGVKSTGIPVVKVLPEVVIPAQPSVPTEQ